MQTAFSRASTTPSAYFGVLGKQIGCPSLGGRSPSLHRIVFGLGFFRLLLDDLNRTNDSVRLHGIGHAGKHQQAVVVDGFHLVLRIEGTHQCGNDGTLVPHTRLECHATFCGFSVCRHLEFDSKLWSAEVSFHLYSEQSFCPCTIL